MLVNLHVKNLALIEEAEVDFAKGLNILTGETGAGKSIIVGSMNLALGEKIPKEMLRDNDAPALVEMIFSVDTEEQKRQLEEMDIYPENDEVILSRRIMAGRSVARVNGETVSVNQLKQIAGIFVDIYGQHEHQTLLNKKKHLELVDAYGHDEIDSIKSQLSSVFKEYKEVKALKEDSVLDDSAKNRELDLLEHEINEIRMANLTVGEDEELEKIYRRMQNGNKAAKAAGVALQYLSGDGESASDLIGRSIRELSYIEGFDDSIGAISNQVRQLEDMIHGTCRELADYLDDLEFSEEEFYETEKRLDVINRLKDKYHCNLEGVLKQCEEKEIRVQQLLDYEEYLKTLDVKYQKLRTEVLDICKELTNIRRKYSAQLTFKVTQALIDLNFLDVKFDMAFHELSEPTNNGLDDAQFIISVNPGEPLKPLDHVASGGELSRIMLAMKSVLAENDKIGTLIFDEIDTGISGRTAQMVSEKMNDIGRHTQVISITHLPQIAAMADLHFLIEKTVENQSTISNIRPLSEDESVMELARMLGGVSITETVVNNAREMKELAKISKH